MTTRPDALLVPLAVADGPRRSRIPNLDRVSRVCDLAEPILGGDRAAGRRAYVRRQKMQGEYFCSLDPNASLLTPATSPHPGRPRYNWVDVGGGLKYGYLADA